MPLSFLMGSADPSTVRGLEWLCDRGEGGTPLLLPERLAYVGLRDVDIYERKILNRLKREHGLFASTMQDVDRLGIGRVMELALQALGVAREGASEGASLHLSFDIDSVDPKVKYSTWSRDIGDAISSCRISLNGEFFYGIPGTGDGIVSFGAF